MCFLLCIFLSLFLAVIYIRLLRYYGRRLGFDVTREEEIFLSVWCLFCWLLICHRLGGETFFSRSSMDSGPLRFFYNYIFMLILTLIGWIDRKSEIIPNLLNLMLFVLGLLGAVFLPDQLVIWDRLIGMLIISGPVIGINVLYPGGFGGGDIKLLAAAGICLGWQGICQAAFIGSAIAALVCIVLLASRRIRRRDTLAYGPYLCIGVMIVLMKGLSMAG